VPTLLAGDFVLCEAERPDTSFTPNQAAKAREVAPRHWMRCAGPTRRG
jgi:hypothetical protein